MSRTKKAQKIARNLRSAGKPDLATRLIEAFNLDKTRGRSDLDLDDIDEMDVDDEEVAQSVADLERYIPVSASMPDELDDEVSLNFDTGQFRALRRR